MPVAPPPSAAPALSEQQTSAASQFAPWPGAQGKDDGRSKLEMLVGSSLPLALPPVSVPHGGLPSTSVVATQPSSVVQHTTTNKAVEMALWRQQEADGVATASAKDAESQSQGTDIGSESDLSQEDPGLGESQSSVTSRTAGSPGQVKQTLFPSITLTPGTPSKPTASQTTVTGMPILGSSKSSQLVSQLTLSSASVSSAQPTVSASSAGALLASKPLFGSHLQPTPIGGSSPQFVASSPLGSGDGRDSPFERGLREHRNTPSPAAQSGEGIQFKTSVQGANTFLSGGTGGEEETAKQEDAKDRIGFSLIPQPATSKQLGEQGSSPAGNRGQASSETSEKEPSSTSATGLTSTHG